ncbi:MAG: hypothetical protein J7L47_04280 [Candidatus Odinarchaeota archaeon]|nr:hypothetical protein [Candidatus Odinarchaeota archaeon]
MDAKKLSTKKAVEILIAVGFTGYFAIFFIFGWTIDFITLVLGGIGAFLLAIITSEEAIVGIDAFGKRTGVSRYVSGVVSSLASNLPEIVVAVIAALNGFTEFAVLVAVIAAGFNTMLFGIVVVIQNTRGKVELPEELVIIETPVMRSAVAMLLLVISFGFLTDIFTPDLVPAIPHEASALLVITYLAYLLFIFSYKGKNGGNNEKVSVPLKEVLVPSILGFGGIFIAAEVLSRVIEISVHIFGISEAVMALLIGLAGSIPEHIIAVTSTLKNKEGSTHLSLGNLLAGIMQSYLLLIGIIGAIVSIILSEFILFEIIAGAVLIWLIKSSISDDNTLSIYEGAMILLTQSFAFIILIDTILMSA